MTEELKTILAALAYALEEGEVDSGGGASALRWLIERADAPRQG